MFKKINYFLIFICAALATPYSHAVYGSVQGQVEYIRTHDASQTPNFAPPLFWFTVKGVTQAGNCAKFEQKVLFVAKDKQSLSLILTAKASGQEINIYFEDATSSNGYCVATYITIM